MRTSLFRRALVAAQVRVRAEGACVRADSAHVCLRRACVCAEGVCADGARAHVCPDGACVRRSFYARLFQVADKDGDGAVSAQEGYDFLYAHAAHPRARSRTRTHTHSYALARAGTLKRTRTHAAHRAHRCTSTVQQETLAQIWDVAGVCVCARARVCGCVCVPVSAPARS
jgi:hypothetical protein